MRKIFLILTLFIFSCDEEETHGCLDSQACNYDSTATIDNNSCEYISDCNGVCGGDAVDLGCGCGEDGLPDGNGYWNHGEEFTDELDGICSEGDDYIDFNGNGICDVENGDFFLNDIVGNGIWDWEDLNENGICDAGECEDFIDESNYDCDGNCITNTCE